MHSLPENLRTRSGAHRASSCCNVYNIPHSRITTAPSGRGILKGVRPENPLNAVRRGFPGEGESEPLPLGGLFSAIFSGVRENGAAGGSTYRKSVKLLYEKCKCKTTERPISIHMFFMQDSSAG